MYNGLNTADPPAFAQGPMVSRWSALAAWLAALVVLIAGIAISGFTVDSGSTRIRAGRELVPTTASVGMVARQGDAVAIGNTAAKAAILGLDVAPFDAAGSGFVIIDASPLPVGAKVALLWATATDPSTLHEQILKQDGPTLVPTPLAPNSSWDGEIAAVAIGVKNPSGMPLLIRDARLVPSTPRLVLADLIRDWGAFDGWDGRSINVVFGGRDEQRVYLPLLAFVAALLAVGALAIRARRRHARLSAALLIIPFIASWILVDLRWQRQLVLQARESYDRFAGKSIDQRHAAMENPAFYSLVAAAERALPTKPARVFVTSDFEYFRLRAGYYLYPQNVLAFDWADPGVLHRGDYLLMFAKSGIEFDRASGQLAWRDGTRLPARALISAPGEGLYVVQ